MRNTPPACELLPEIGSVKRLSDRLTEERRDSVRNLKALRSHPGSEVEPIREALQPGTLTRSQASILEWVHAPCG